MNKSSVNKYTDERDKRIDNKPSLFNKQQLKETSNKESDNISPKAIQDGNTTNQKPNITKDNNENIDTDNLKKVFKKHLPKNVNQYRHIIDTMQSRDSDVEWVLELRAYNPKQSYETLKDSIGYYPDIYRNSFNDYKAKVEKEQKEKRENKLRLKGNSRDFEHVMNRRIGLPANPTQLGFDSTLRSFDPEKVKFNNVPWKTLALSPKKNLLSTYLPPTTNTSKENLMKIGEYVARPWEQFEDVKY